jgi:tetratricopeptide (TPR) repeat protein
VIEDLHWIDAETQAVLDRLVESLPTARILLLVNYRPEYRHDWGGKTYYRQLPLDPLGPENATALLESLLGGDTSLDPLKRLLLARTEGNPFFLEESVRSLVDEGVLAGERGGAYRLVKTLENVHVPATVQAILAARIDRLPAEDKALLQTAAVIGTDVPIAVLTEVDGGPAGALAPGLTRLQAAEFLYETRLFPDVEYTFKHALTHEVAYGSLLQERRRALHARIVEAIEALSTGRLAEHVERLAYHATRGEVWEKAVLYLRQAGARAFARSVNQEAVAHFEHALEALAHLPETRDTTEQGIDLRLGLRTALFVLGEFGRGVELLHETDRLAQMLNDSRRLGWVSFFMGHNHFMMDESTPQRVFAERALAIAETLADRRLRVAARCLLGTSYFDSGEYRRAEDVLRTAVASLDDDLTHDPCNWHVFPAVQSRAWLARALAECGAFDQGIVFGKEALRIAEAIGHSYSLAQAIRNLAYLYSLKGEFGSAAPSADRAPPAGRPPRESQASVPAVPRGGPHGAAPPTKADASGTDPRLAAGPSPESAVDHGLHRGPAGAAPRSVSLPWTRGDGTVRVLSGNQRQRTPTRPRGQEAEDAYSHGVGPRTLGSVAPGSDLLSRGPGVRFPPGAPFISAHLHRIEVFSRFAQCRFSCRFHPPNGSWPSARRRPSRSPG